MTDGKTSVSLFGETTALKSYNPSLKIFVSVGGWTFSDNGTATQPLLGQISASGPKRRAFAANVVSFLHENGFDGLDLDWYIYHPIERLHMGFWASPLTTFQQGISRSP